MDQPYAGTNYVDGHLKPVMHSMIDDGFKDDHHMLIAALLHDGPEDAPDRNYDIIEVRLDVIRYEFSELSGLLVQAVTGIGPNRKARNAAIRAGLAAVPAAAPLKGHDRLINARTSRTDNPGLHKMYVKEYPDFREMVFAHISSRLMVMLDNAHG